MWKLSYTVVILILKVIILIQTLYIETTNAQTTYTWKLVAQTNLTGLDDITSGEGIATDGESFYFNGRIYVTRTNFEYQQIPPFSDTGVIPTHLLLKGYNHIGDSEIYEGIYYAGIERERVLLNASLATFNASTMQFITNEITAQSNMPWIAVDHQRKLIYTSEWDPVTYFNIYDLNLKFISQQNISNYVMSSPQGGAFYDGLLYVACNDDYVHVFDVPSSGDASLVQSIETGINAEMEGITFVDLRSQNQGIMHITDGNILRPFDGKSKHALYHYDIIQN